MKVFITLFLIFFTLALGAKTVHYELTATKGKINLSGKAEIDFALMLNGNIPAPTLEFSEGDEAVIVVKNMIPDDEISIHWHGILLDPMMEAFPMLPLLPSFPEKASPLNLNSGSMELTGTTRTPMYRNKKAFLVP